MTDPDDAPNPFSAPESDRETIMQKLARVPGILVFFFAVIGTAMVGVPLDPTMGGFSGQEMAPVVVYAILYCGPCALAAIICGRQAMKRGEANNWHRAGFVLGVIDFAAVGLYLLWLAL